MSKKKRPLLLGVGNILLSDEGIGVRAIEVFEQQHPGLASSAVDIIDGGTAGMELLDDIASRPLVIIVDAMKSKDKAGTVKCLEQEKVPRFFAQKLSPHQLGLSDLLSALVMTDEFPEKLFLVGIVPESIEPGIALSQTITEKFNTITEMIEKLLREEGVC